jgi:hypothetical protein
LRTPHVAVRDYTEHHRDCADRTRECLGDHAHHVVMSDGARYKEKADRDKRASVKT